MLKKHLPGAQNPEQVLSNLLSKRWRSAETLIILPTVNLLAMPSVVRIHLPPPERKSSGNGRFSFCFSYICAGKVLKIEDLY